MDDQTMAGLPGPCHKLTATGWSWPHKRYSQHTVHYLHIYILNVCYGPMHEILLFRTRRNLQERIIRSEIFGWKISACPFFLTRRNNFHVTDL